MYILHEFIFKKEFFTVNVLNWRIRCFRFDDNEPPLFTEQNLKSMTTKMTASEMMGFVLNAPLIFGDLIKDQTNKHWKLFKLLRSILILSLKNSITTSDIKSMKRLVTEHHKLYVELYGHTLKPKHHFLLHYALIMEVVGPLKNLWTMRLEGKHRPSKIYAKVNYNRKDLCYSIALKNQLNLSDVFLKNKSCQIRMPIFEPNLRNLYFSEKILLPNRGINFDSIDYLIINGCKYVEGSVILVSNDKQLPTFGVIEKLFFMNKTKGSDAKDFTVILSTFESLYFDDHLQL